MRQLDRYITNARSTADLVQILSNADIQKTLATVSWLSPWPDDDAISQDEMIQVCAIVREHARALERIDLYSIKLDAPIASELAGFAKLGVLALLAVTLYPDALEILGQSKTLHTLKLDLCEIAADAQARLCKLPWLKTLQIDPTTVATSTLETLSKSSTLKHLILGHPSDSDSDSCASITDLEVVSPFNP